MYPGSVVKICNRDKNLSPEIQNDAAQGFATHSVLEKNPKDHCLVAFSQPFVDVLAYRTLKKVGRW